jgi:serine/threonine protein kinase
VSLSLEKRLNIAAGAAEGLAYMHSKTSTTILHGDIKPSNILLDDNFNPKISDFGISRLIAIEKTHTNFVVGDMCYMDPIYLQSGLLTKQSDVYSFGLTLLELLTRQKQKDDFGGHGRLAKAFLDAYTEKGGIELFESEVLVEN